MHLDVGNYFLFGYELLLLISREGGREGGVVMNIVEEREPAAKKK